VPYLKFSRDKRGYENFFLFEPPHGERDQATKGRPRLLFWFRTPPSVKVGRMPFSDDVRRMVEAQNPGLTFDWARIMSTPIPSAEAEQWRERRRAEKAARRAVRDAEDAAEAQAAVDEAEAQPVAVAEEPTSEPEDVAAVEDAITGTDDVDEAQGPAGMTSPTSDSQAQGPHESRRRRRRRRRGGGHGQQTLSQPAPESSGEMTSAQQDATAPPRALPSDEV